MRDNIPNLLFDNLRVHLRPRRFVRVHALIADPQRGAVDAFGVVSPYLRIVKAWVLVQHPAGVALAVHCQRTGANGEAWR
jgi:hypothetical protein